MKKSSTRTVLFCLLVAASMSSYIFLSSVSSPNAASSHQAKEENYEEKSGDAHIILPDVQLIKKVVEAGKRLIPAS